MVNAAAVKNGKCSLAVGFYRPDFGETRTLVFQYDLPAELKLGGRIVLLVFILANHGTCINQPDVPAVAPDFSLATRLISLKQRRKGLPEIGDLLNCKDQGEDSWECEQ